MKRALECQAVDRSTPCANFALVRAIRKVRPPIFDLVFPALLARGQTLGVSKGGEVIFTEPPLVKGGVNTPPAKSLLLPTANGRAVRMDYTCTIRHHDHRNSMQNPIHARQRSAVMLMSGFLLLLASEVSMACPDVLDHKMKDLEGNDVNLCDFAGKVVLAVNTASYCGNTPQYKGLEALHERYQDKGLVVIGFPANDFGAQEPGSSKDIKDFCERTYGVAFPMMEKTSVVPGKANPVFDKLTQLTGDAPEWNFHKYLIARDGKRAFSFSARTQPESKAVVSRIEELLAE